MDTVLKRTRALETQTNIHNTAPEVKIHTVY